MTDDGRIGDTKTAVTGALKAVLGLLFEDGLFIPLGYLLLFLSVCLLVLGHGVLAVAFALLVLPLLVGMVAWEAFA